jgi:hypothetical protein
MANAIYSKFKETIMQAGINMASATLKVALVDTGTYTFSDSHQFLSSLSGVVGTAQTLGSKTFTSGVFDAADVTFPLVSGATAEALVIYRDTGVAGTSDLIAYLDTGYTNLPVTPNGGDISVAWDNGANKIFKL